MSEDKSSAVNRIAVAKQKYEESVRTETNKLKEELYTALQAVLPIYTTLSELGINVWVEPKLEPLLQSLKLDVVKVSEPKEKKSRAPRKAWPQVSLEAVTELVKGAGAAGSKAGDLSKHFGPSFAKWRKDNEKKFTISKDGVTKFWKLKK